MTETKKRDAQIEMEALAVTWACGLFSNYVLGQTFQIESDRKPLSGALIKDYVAFEATLRQNLDKLYDK